VEIRAADGTVIVLDCGTGAHALGKALVASDRTRRGHLLITHMHWDHIQGFPFFAPLQLPASEWDVYGPRGLGSSLRDALAGQMNYTYFPVDLTGLDARVHYRELVDGTFELGDVHVEARYLNHPAVTLGYRLEADGVVVVYATDHEPHSRQLAIGLTTSGMTCEDDAHADFLEGADVVIHDTQYTAEEYIDHVGWGHSTVEYVVDRTRDKDIQRVVLFHHDPMRSDEGIDRLVSLAKERYAAASERIDVLGAAEGTTLKLERRARISRKRGNEKSAQRAPVCPIETQKVVLCAREPDNIKVFRHAAVEDKLTLLETTDLEDAITSARENSPSVIIFEQAAFGSHSDAGVCSIRDAFSNDGPEPILMGLVPIAQDVSAALCTARDIEWVETPLTEEFARTRLRACLLRTACRWRRAPVAADEPERLDVLQGLGILDSPPEERFDRYTRLAAALFRVPIALISLVDSDRQWFKSKHGLDVQETPRDRAFCAHAILKDGVFQVVDARVHPDFADNPLVSGPPYIRFYAGTPLKVHGRYRVGTLCLIDHLPRELDATEKGLLKDLGQLVEREIELSKASLGL
jgi:phosphoribosyl 1,2-cyclic phosphodiesterase